MKRTLALCVMTLLAAPLAFADQTTLGVPDTTCQTPEEWRLHDYNTDPPETGVYAGLATALAATEGHWPDSPHRPSKYMYPYLDGNMEECATTFPLTAEECQTLRDAGLPVDFLCSWDQPGDFDGDLEFGWLARALLVSRSGNGLIEGGIACYNTVGHHPEGGTITVTDLASPYVYFLVIADYTNPLTIPIDFAKDCGDGIVQPCDPYHPDYSDLPQPVGGVVDTVNALLWSLLNQDGLTCLLQDQVQECLNSCAVRFGPGADGAYHVRVGVTLAGNEGEPTAATQGHVYL